MQGGDCLCEHGDYIAACRLLERDNRLDNMIEKEYTQFSGTYVQAAA
jgi:hypothetical protein